MLNIVLFGPPGSGKGTQAAKLVAKYNLVHLSTGDIFRTNIKGETELGKLAKGYLDKGQLVPDEVTINMLQTEVAKYDTVNGFIFDGFPRTIPQAEAMKSAGVKLDFVLEIDVPFDAIIERMSGRRAHVASGRTYHLKFNPPKVAGLDDVTGEPLIQRDDDKEETVRKRLDVYSAQTRPLVDYYSNWAKTDPQVAPQYRAINGLGSVEDIKARAFAALK